MLFLFRFGHPRVFIPWSDVSLHEGSRHGVAFHFARAPGVPLILSKPVAGKLAELSDGGLDYRPSSPVPAEAGGRSPGSSEA